MDAQPKHYARRIKLARQSRLDGIDLDAAFLSFRERGATVHQIATDLGISPSYAHALRARYTGLNPARSLDKAKVLGALRSGHTIREVADMFSVSREFVRTHAKANNVPTSGGGAQTSEPQSFLDIRKFIEFHFRYEPETGRFFRDGKEVGAVMHGYLVVKVKDRKILGHRLAWFLHYGEEPPRVLDHADGNPLNNAITNIREASHSQNAFNRKRSVSNTTGVKGVSKDRRCGVFRVSVMAYGQKVFCSAHDLASAVEKRRRLADELHGEFARHD